MRCRRLGRFWNRKETYMQTYKYQFPASGDLSSEVDAEAFKEVLEEKLKKGQNSLASYAMFPTDSDILDHVSFEMDDKYAVRAINLHTYTKLWAGNEDYLKDCIDENLSELYEQYDFEEYEMGAYIEGPVKALGREGDIPKTLYHIVESDYVKDILINGIDPGADNAGYRNDKDHIYLCEEKDLAPWLAILKHNEDPVILEVNTDGLSGIETGRVYSDRNFVNGSYAEYKTSDPIPAAAIKEADLTKEFCAKLFTDMSQMAGQIEGQHEFKELTTGMIRLNNMGILRIADVQSRADEAIKRDIISEVGEEEAFADAVNALQGLDTDHIIEQ